MSPITPTDRGYAVGALRVRTDENRIVVEVPNTGDEDPRLTGWQAMDLALALAGRSLELLRCELGDLSEDADAAALQCDFWRGRAIELGADPSELPGSMRRQPEPMCPET